MVHFKKFIAHKYKCKKAMGATYTVIVYNIKGSYKCTHFKKFVIKRLVHIIRFWRSKIFEH